MADHVSGEAASCLLEDVIHCYIVKKMNESAPVFLPSYPQGIECLEILTTKAHVSCDNPAHSCLYMMRFCKRVDNRGEFLA